MAPVRKLPGIFFVFFFPQQHNVYPIRQTESHPADFRGDISGRAGVSAGGLLVVHGRPVSCFLICGATGQVTSFSDFNVSDHSF